MGVVLKARQTKLDRLVALKVLPRQTASDSAFAERFSREARALAKLSHSHIVTVHDFGQVEGQSYIVMEFVAGMNLRQRLRAGRMPVDDVLAIMAQLCDALQYAHDEGIIHRDIKPENILFDRQGRVRLADFGLAKLTAPTAADYTLTGAGQVMGTWNYMAPEQLDNPLAVDRRADIYSLGVVFYEMLTGEVPRARFALPSQKAAIDIGFDEVVLRALEREPDRRYQQIREFRRALDSVAAQTVALPSLPGAPIAPLQATTVAEQNAPALKPIGVLIVAALCLVCWPTALILLVPLVVWLWLTVRRPDGKALVKSRLSKAEAWIRTAGRITVGNTTAWAIGTSFLGIVVSLQPLLPVAELVVLSPSVLPSRLVAVYPYQSVFGILPAIIFAVVLLFHIAAPTGGRTFGQIARAALLFFAGAIILLATLVPMSTCQIRSRSYSTHQGGITIEAFGQSLGASVPVTIQYVASAGVIEAQAAGNSVRLPLSGTSIAAESLLSRVQVSIAPAAFASPVLGAVLVLLACVKIRVALRPKVGARG
jgi:hypothetical protein